MADFDISTYLAQALEMEQMLGRIYDDFLPLVSQFVNLGRAVGGLGALIFIASRVWGHLARAEPIDVFPLLRPFLIGLVILLFPSMLGVLRGVTGALSHATDGVVTDRNREIVQLQAQKRQILANRPENRKFEVNQAFEDELEKFSALNLNARANLYFDRTAYQVKKEFREWMRNALELFHVAARLLISVAATFLLIVLSVVGPLTFGIAIFPGFQQSIPQWLGNFLTVSLWVPVANIFGAIMGQIQVRLLQHDITRLQDPTASVDGADFGYLCFLVMAIAGYFLVPFATEKLIAASGAGDVSRSIVQRVTGGAALAGSAAGVATREAAGAASQSAGAVGRYANQAGNAMGRMFGRRS